MASTWDGFIFTYRLSGIITTAITWLAGTRRGTGPNDVSRSGGDSPAARGRYATEQADREARAETNAEALENCTGLAPGVTNLPIDQIRQTVHPTADQEAALDNLSSASSQAGEIIKSSCPTSVPLTPIGRLDAAEQRLDTTIKAIRMVLLPLQRFYEMLSDEQRVRFSAMKRSTEGARSPSNMAEYVLLRCASCRILSVISLFPSYFATNMGPAGYTRGGRVDLLSVLRFIPIGVFDDATVRTIGGAFDAACKELKDTGQPDVVHEVMIKRIIAAARRGERNVTRLRDAALTGLGKPRNEIRG